MTFSKEFKEIIDIVAEKLGIAVDWTQENIMPWITDILHRFVTFNIIVSVLTTAVAFAFLVLGIIIIVKFIKDYVSRKKSFLWEDDFSFPTLLGFIMIIAAAMSMLISGLIFPDELQELLKWIVIPEFKVVEELTALIGQ